MGPSGPLFYIMDIANCYINIAALERASVYSPNALGILLDMVSKITNQVEYSSIHFTQRRLIINTLVKADILKPYDSMQHPINANENTVQGFFGAEKEEVAAVDNDADVEKQIETFDL